ncbi:MAG: alpha/beta hydrolase [Pseudomonadota bacterium]
MDMDDAYQNAAYIPGGDSYPDKWAQAAAAFRQSATAELDLPYGESPRQRYDLFHPDRLAKGLLVFVHGGYWLRFDKSYWSHLAAGPLAQGWAVAMPSYDLCPDVRISDITQQVVKAIGAAAVRVPGPVRLAGHSAGGHLVARSMARHAGARWQERVERVTSISPVSDLAPLMQTKLNETLQIDPDEAARESPIHQPRPAVPVTVWVGADERPAFLDQAHWLAEAWEADHVIAEGEHHFSVIEGLADPTHALTLAVLG